MRDDSTYIWFDLGVVINGENLFREEIDISANNFYEEVKRVEVISLQQHSSDWWVRAIVSSTWQQYDAVISIHLSQWD